MMMIMTWKLIMMDKVIYGKERKERKRREESMKREKL